MRLFSWEMEVLYSCCLYFELRNNQLHQKLYRPFIFLLLHDGADLEWDFLCILSGVAAWGGNREF